ncbi:PAS domain-containing protein [Thiomonas sp. FB-6]|uniref:PAS domain-containing protein n=1 Tax=Thiomonas sp. FB-6 TaxID=1158291 RepID=UPI00037FC9E5|nr:PAS domain-containing protein [Thiomonas sp. FB-6]
MAELPGSGRPAPSFADARRASDAEERRLRALVAASSDAVYEMNADWSEIRFLDGRGFVADAVLPTRDWMERYVPPGEQAMVLRHIQAAIRERGRFDLEHRLIREDGSIGWAHSRAVPILDDTGAPCAWMGVAMDVTVRKEAELELRASEQRLRAVTEHMTDGIFYLDRSHAIRYLNSAGIEWLRGVLGLPALQAAQVLGHRLRDIAGDTEPSRGLLLHDEQAMAGGRATSVEAMTLSSGGLRNRVTLRVPIRGADGEVVGLLGIVRDLTQRMREESARVAQVQNQRDVLVREVHHRIKNHLQGMLGLLRLHVARRPSVAGPLSEVMAQVHAIAGVYGISGPPDARGVDLGHTTELVVQGAVGAVPLQFENACGTPVLLREADAVPIALVINELVTNAVKHLAPATPGRPVRVVLRREAEAVLVQVRGGPACLPQGFELGGRRGPGIGLQLLGTLLPSKGTKLRIEQHADEVLAELELREPVVELR